MKRLPAESATVRDVRLRAGFSESESPTIVRHLGALDRTLRPYQRDRVVMDIGVKDRDKMSQQVTLSCDIAGTPLLVATTASVDMNNALNAVRVDMRRQLINRRSEVVERGR